MWSERATPATSACMHHGTVFALAACSLTFRSAAANTAMAAPSEWPVTTTLEGFNFSKAPNSCVRSDV